MLDKPEEPPIKDQNIWEATSLAKTIENFILNDSKFAGLSRYIVNVRIFWSRSIDTACAGHGFIFFNPDFFAQIPEETRKAVFAHEIWHLILKHLDRGKKADPEIFGKAADHVNNLNLKSDGFTFDGTKPLMDNKFDGLSTEQVYNILYKESKNDPNQVMKGDYITAETIENMVEEVLENDGNNITLEDQKSKAEDEVDLHTKHIGNQAGNTAIKLELSTNKVLIQGATYKQIFEPYLTDPLSGGKRTFMRPNRRQHGKSGSLRLPGRYPKRGHLNRLKHLVYALDVSGSITPHQAQQFHDSVRTLKELLNPSKLTVLFFDTKIVEERVFTDKQIYGEITVNAGGGTNLTDVYERANELNPEALIVFTDLCVGIPQPQPKWDSIWLVPNTSARIPDSIYGDVYLIPTKENV